MKTINQFFDRQLSYLWKMGVVFLLSISSLNAYAQGSKITLPQTPMTIKAAFEEVEKQSDLSVAYNEAVIDVAKTINVNVSEQSLTEAMNAILRGTGTTFKIQGKQIIIAAVSPATTAPPATAPSAENTKYSGTVLDENGESIAGAFVGIPGTQINTITDSYGRFTIDAPANSVLNVSLVGFETQQVRLGSNIELAVTMQENSRIIDEVVVVGYGTQRRINLTGAVNTVDVGKQLEGRSISDVGRGLQGSVPGLSVTTSSGKIGGDPRISIRGSIGSLSNEEGSARPLILVDNVEISNLSTLNPDEIESISVLKDAASSSIYGVKAAFGVILITTKKAKAGDKFQVGYSTNLSWNSPTKVPEIVKSYEGAELALMAQRRVSPSTNLMETAIHIAWNEETIERMREWERVYGGLKLSPEMVKGRDFDEIGGKMYFYRSFDAPALFIKDHSFMQNHNISANGSSGKSSYNLNLGFLGQQGILKVKTDSFNRYNASFNTTTYATKWMDIRTKLLFSRTVFETPFSYNSSDNYDGWYYLYRWPSIMPYGTYQGIPFHNGISDMQQANMNTRTNDYWRINLGTTIKITSDVSVDADYTFTKTDRLTETRGGEAEGWDFWPNGKMEYRTWTTADKNKIQKDYETSDRHTANVIARWNKTLGKGHELGVFAGTNIEYYTNNGVWASRQGLLDPDMPEFSLAVGDQMSVGGAHDQSSTVGIFARINYSYKNRYLLELNGRYDGSSSFPVDKLWGFFPSMSAGYVLSEENFMQPVKDWLSFVKVRFSWGSIGNDRVVAQAFRPLMPRVTSSTWMVGNTAPETMYGLPRVIDKGFTWETITTLNLGADVRFFKDKLGVSVDIFKRTNKDMIVQASGYPAFYGVTTTASLPYMNYGQMETKGWELSVDFRHRFGNGLAINASAHISDAVIRITKHPRASKLLDGGNYEGKTIGEIWGYVTDRYFTEADFDVDPGGNYVLKPGIPSQEEIRGAGQTWFQYGPGDIKYTDLNGNGKIDPMAGATADNSGDMKIIGNTTPRYQYGIRLGADWKGFDLGIFIQGVGKREMWGTGNVVIPGFIPTEAWYTHHLDYWTPENPDAYYPKISNLAQSNNTQNFYRQTKYLLDMSYCRLKNVTLGYSLPKKWLQKIHLNKLRVYASFENLFEIDHLGNIPIDPETALTTGDGDFIGRSYPYSRTSSIGVQLSF